MPVNMPAEARCQEDRGINAETWLRNSGVMALKVQTGDSTAAGIIIYELKSKTHFVLDKGYSLFLMKTGAFFAL